MPSARGWTLRPSSVGEPSGHLLATHRQTAMSSAAPAVEAATVPPMSPTSSPVLHTSQTVAGMTPYVAGTSRATVVRSTSGTTQPGAENTAPLTDGARK